MRLTAAGYEPHVHRRLTLIHVVAKVPGEPSPTRWQARLAALMVSNRYEQIAADLSKRIEDGILPAAARLPSAQRSPSAAVRSGRTTSWLRG